MRQRRWLELIKDYDLTINYHPGKANVVADALSRKAHCKQLSIEEYSQELTVALAKMEIKFRLSSTEANIATMTFHPTLLDQIKEKQKSDAFIVEEARRIRAEQPSEFRLDEEGVLWNHNRICVPDVPELKEIILREAHDTLYTIHPGSTKMYRDLKGNFWWRSMKKEIAEYVSKCDTCQKVKAEHQRPAGLLKPLDVPDWKWEDICMDFITGLPMTLRKKDDIWVVVDRLTKSAHFIPTNQKYSYDKLAELYLERIVSIHGVPKTITSDRGSVFTSSFWKSLHHALGTELNFSTAYHPQTDGQTERVNQILEDMLRCCAMNFGESWDKHLHLAEFAYNNSYQSSIEMAPYEALYGRKCRSPICWYEVGEKPLLGPSLVRENDEKIQVIKERLQIAQSRQKSYADKRRRELEFAPGDFVYLKVSPMRGVRRFGIKGKLSPRYIGPFKVLEQKGTVAYQLELPIQLSKVHDVFHVSQLKKCLREPSEQLQDLNIKLQPDLSYEERPLKILEVEDRQLRRRKIRFCKVQWKNHSIREATWEKEDDLRKAYPDLFKKRAKSGAGTSSEPN